MQLHNINPKSFYRWQKTLRDEAAITLLSSEQDIFLELKAPDLPEMTRPFDGCSAMITIRNFCIGKKYRMMVDTKSGAYAAACMCSIVETVKANNLKTYEYLTYVLEEMSKCMQDLNTEVPERLMPWSVELSEYVRRNDTKQ